MVWSTVANPSPPSSEASSWSGYTARVLIPSSELTVVNGAEMVRLTFRSPPSHGTTLASTYFQKSASSAPSFLSTPVQVTWNSGSASLTMSAATTYTSDPIHLGEYFDASYTYGYVMSTYLTGDYIAYIGSTPYTAYYKNASDASTVSVSGYTTVPGSRYFLDLLEVRTMK